MSLLGYLTIHTKRSSFGYLEDVRIEFPKTTSVHIDIRDILSLDSTGFISLKKIDGMKKFILNGVLLERKNADENYHSLNGEYFIVDSFRDRLIVFWANKVLHAVKHFWKIIFHRFMWTLYIWGIAEGEVGQIPSIKDIKILKIKE